MRGCKCCGQVPGVRDGSMTMGFLAIFFSSCCSRGNRLFNAGLHASERLDSAAMNNMSVGEVSMPTAAQSNICASKA